MKAGSFFKGMGVGALAGAALLVATMPARKKVRMKNTTAKAIRAVGDVVGSITGLF